MALSPKHIEIIETEFFGAERIEVIAELGRISPDHTWQSQYNLDNTIGAILALSDGDIKKLGKLVDVALIDFRDVIYWWTIEQAQPPFK